MLSCEFERPETTQALTQRLAQGHARLLAGGTDLIPRLHRAGADAGADGPQTLLDLSALRELRFIRAVDGRIEIGALSTHADLAASPLLHECAPALAAAAAQVGSPQTRNRGTLGGNLANASPAADTLPPLLCLDAALTLISAAGTRVLALSDFLTGPGRTALLPGEWIHSVSFSQPAAAWGAGFEKLGRRSGMAIAVVSAAALLQLDGQGRIQTARLALGSVAPTALRCTQVEALLAGRAPEAALWAEAAQAVSADIAPIGDVRATREYRLRAAAVLTRRLFEKTAAQALEKCA